MLQFLRVVEKLGKFHNGSVLVPYGATEALPVSWADGSEISKFGILAGRRIFIGKPISGAEIKILENARTPCDYPDDKCCLDNEKVGEI